MARLDWQEPQPGGQGYRLGAALGVEFAHDGIHVKLYSMLAHRQARGDPFVGQSLGQQPQDIVLPGG